MTTDPAPIPEIHDFDFIFGRWNVANRRLRQRHAGADDWDEFLSTSTCEPRLGGLTNVEEVSCPARDWTGMALRAFDVEACEWSIWWIGSLDGRLQPPVRGRFTAGGCVLEGSDMDGDRPVRVRFIWSDITPVSARWTQAFSTDRGRTWETNWVMDFTRMAA